MKKNRKNRAWPFVVLAAVTLTALILAAVLLLSGGTDDHWQEQYDLGCRYLEEGNYEEAILAFSAAIEIDPKRAEAYLGRGEAYMELGEYEKAQEDFEKAQRRAEDDEEIEKKVEKLEQKIEEKKEKEKQTEESVKKLTYMYYTDGGYIEEWDFSYNEQDLMIGAVCHGYYDGGGKGNPHIWTFEYDEEGRILRVECTYEYIIQYAEQYYYREGLLIQKYIENADMYEYYEYDSNGNLIKQRNEYYAYDSFYEDITEYTYDSQNRMIQSSLYTGLGGEWIDTTYYYDSVGNLTESISLLHGEYEYEHCMYDYSYPLLAFKNQDYGEGYMASWLTVSDIPTDAISSQYVGFMPQIPSRNIHEVEDGYLTKVYEIIDGSEYTIWEFRYEDIGGETETTQTAPGAPDNYVDSIPLGVSCSYDMNGDGMAENILVETLEDSTILTIGSVSEEYEYFTISPTGYYTIIDIYGDGSELLLGISDWGPSEDHSTELFAYDGTSIINVGWFDAILGETAYGEGGARVLGDGTIAAYTRMDVLGTWFADALYEYDDGILWDVSYFHGSRGYPARNSWEVTTKCDLTMYKEPFYEDYVVLPAGTVVRMTGCVLDSATMFWVAFESDAFDGTLWAYVSALNWPEEEVQTPQGSTPAEDAFEGFYYAG